MTLEQKKEKIRELVELIPSDRKHKDFLLSGLDDLSENQMDNVIDSFTILFKKN